MSAAEMDRASKSEAEPLPVVSRDQLLAGLAARVISVGTVVLLFVWILRYMGGLDWEGGRHFFNAHPFFMILGVGFFLTNGVLSWRDVGRGLGHGPAKIMHVLFNSLGLGCIGIGLFVTIRKSPAPHMSDRRLAPALRSELDVSLHSWFALVSTALLAIQALGGAFFFALPMFPFSVRAKMLPLHAWLGAVSYIFMNFVLMTGLVQWMVYRGQAAGGHRSFMTSTANILANVMGMFILASTLCTAYAILPRRNLEADIEERDGVRFDHPSRSRLKGPYSAGGAQYSASNPFPAEAVPPRRTAAPEREVF